jgi:simple sugar transport system ATP-binding protein
MRAGYKVGTWKTDETTADTLIAHMIGRGRDVHLTRRRMPESAPVLQLQALQVEGDRGIDALRSLSLTVRAGEILGIAGVEGNGQRELGEAITGLCQLKSGDILFDGQSIRDVPTIEVLRRGVGFVPEDRHHDALVLPLSVAENAVLVSHADSPFDRRGLIVSEAITAFTRRLIEEFRIRCNGTNLAVRTLSGGNQQKLVLGREIVRNPRLLIAMQPTRGLDVGAIDYVHSRLIDARNVGPNAVF